MTETIADALPRVLNDAAAGQLANRLAEQRRQRREELRVLGVPDRDLPPAVEAAQ